MVNAQGAEYMKRAKPNGHYAVKSKTVIILSFFGVPCNGEAARYDDSADGPVVWVTGSGQRYTQRVSCSSRRQHKIFSLFARTKTSLDANGQHRYDPMMDVVIGGGSFISIPFF